jgi:hypothetical protein
MSLKKVFKTFLEEERQNRRFIGQEECATATGFLDWCRTETTGLKTEVETISLFGKAYEASRRLKLETKPTRRTLDQFRLSHTLAAPQEDVTSKDVSNYITQQVYRRKWRGELYNAVNGERNYQTGQYVFSLPENPISNRKMNCNRVRTDDGNMKFVIRARCNTLPTP